MNIIVFFISMLFLTVALTLYPNQPIKQIDFKAMMHDVILISYAFCAVFTISFFFLSTSLIQELFEAIEK